MRSRNPYFRADPHRVLIFIYIFIDSLSHDVYLRGSIWLKDHIGLNLWGIHISKCLLIYRSRYYEHIKYKCVFQGHSNGEFTSENINLENPMERNRPLPTALPALSKSFKIIK